MNLKGRHLVFGWTAVLLIVAGIIAIRDRKAFDTIDRLAAVEDSLEVINRIHAEVASELATLQAPGSLQALGEELGLRAPSDSEQARVRVTGN